MSNQKNDVADFSLSNFFADIKELKNLLLIAFKSNVDVIFLDKEYRTKEKSHLTEEQYNNNIVITSDMNLSKIKEAIISKFTEKGIVPHLVELEYFYNSLKKGEKK